MTRDYEEAVDAMGRMEALCKWAGIEQDPAPIQGRKNSTLESAALTAFIHASRAISLCKAWINQLDEDEARRVKKRLGERREWYALAIWNKMNDPGAE